MASNSTLDCMAKIAMCHAISRMIEENEKCFQEPLRSTFKSFSKDLDQACLDAYIAFHANRLPEKDIRKVALKFQHMNKFAFNDEYDNGFDFKYYTSFCMELLDDSLNKLKTPDRIKAFNSLHDIIYGLHLYMDPDYEDTHSAEKGTKAFNIWQNFEYTSKGEIKDFKFVKDGKGNVFLRVNNDNKGE